MRYLVGIGGRPRESFVECDTFSEAYDRCLAEAIRMAEEKGIDPDTVECYDGEDRHGACPEGNDGAFWPIILVE